MTTAVEKWTPPKDDRAAVSAGHCLFHHDTEVRFAEKVEGQPFRVRIRATSGEPFSHGWWGTIAIDLAGIKFARQDMPILLDHDTAKIAGWTTRIFLESGSGLVAEGVLTSKTAEGEYVRKLAEDGCPWQASVYLQAQVIEDVASGSEVEVNGYKLTGPATVLRKTRLREVTVTALGADENTDAEMFGERGKGPIMAEVIRATTAAPATPTTAVVMTAELPSAEAVKLAERHRVATIFSSAAPYQQELARELVAKETSLEEALVALIQGRNEHSAEKLEQRTASAPPATGGDPKKFREVVEAVAPGADVDAAEFDKRARAAFRKTPALATAFDEDGFAAHAELVRLGHVAPVAIMPKGLVN